MIPIPRCRPFRLFADTAHTGAPTTTIVTFFRPVREHTHTELRTSTLLRRDGGGTNSLKWLELAQISRCQRKGQSCQSGSGAKSIARFVAAAVATLTSTALGALWLTHTHTLASISALPLHREREDLDCDLDLDLGPDLELTCDRLAARGQATQIGGQTRMKVLLSSHCRSSECALKPKPRYMKWNGGNERSPLMRSDGRMTNSQHWRPSRRPGH